MSRIYFCHAIAAVKFKVCHFCLQ